MKFNALIKPGQDEDLEAAASRQIRKWFGEGASVSAIDPRLDYGKGGVVVRLDVDGVPEDLRKKLPDRPSLFEVDVHVYQGENREQAVDRTVHEKFGSERVRAVVVRWPEGRKADDGGSLHEKVVLAVSLTPEA